MSDIVIEKNVPAPPSTRRNKYPFSQMEVGDSFFTTEQKNVVRSAANWHSIKNHTKFRTRIEGDGLRVWRVE